MPGVSPEHAGRPPARRLGADSPSSPVSWPCSSPSYAGIATACSAVWSRRRGRRSRVAGVGAVLRPGRLPAEMARTLPRADGWPAPRSHSRSVLAAAVAVAVIVTRWLTAAWQRTAWIALAVVAVGQADHRHGAADAAGHRVRRRRHCRHGLLVAFGTPDRRLGNDGVVAALAAGGFPVVSATLAADLSKGSRPFVVVDAVRATGSSSRSWGRTTAMPICSTALSRAPSPRRRRCATSRIVEAGSRASSVGRGDGGTLGRACAPCRACDRGRRWLRHAGACGSSTERCSRRFRTNGSPTSCSRQLWREVATLHARRYRPPFAADRQRDGRSDGRPWVVDFSFSELSASNRAIDLDVAELLASSASKVGPDRAVAVAADVLGAQPDRPRRPATAAARAVGGDAQGRSQR